MFNTSKSPAITKQVGAFLLGDDRANYLKGVAEDITNNIDDAKLQLEVDEFEIGCQVFGIDIQYIYCMKTGRRIGTRDRSEIELLFRLNKTLGRVAEQTPEYIEFSAGCSPAWLNTDSEHLQSLMKCDPHGYVMYILGYAARNAFKHLQMKDNKQVMQAAPDQETSRKVNQSMIRGYAELQRQPITRVVETAEMLQRFFTVYNPKEIKWPMRMPGHYCTAEGLNELFDNMEKQINHVVLERNLFSRTITNIKIRDAIKKAGGTGGASNIIGQGKKRGNLADDQIADLFISMRMDMDAIRSTTVEAATTQEKREVAQAKIKQVPQKNRLSTVKPTAKFSFTAKAT